MCSTRQLRKLLDQRFPALLQEAGYKKDVEMQVVRAGGAASALVVLFVGAGMIAVKSDLDNPEWPWRFAHDDPRTWANATKFFSAVVGLLNTVMCFLRSHLGWLTWWDWEVHVLAFATIGMILNALNSSRWALLFGLRPEEVYTYDTSGDEAFELLTLDAMTTVLCIFVPIRSCVLWVAPVVGVVVHLAMGIVCGGCTSIWFCSLSTAVLIVLAVLSLTGAFWNERTARERFLAVRDVQAQEQLLSNQYFAISRILARFCDCLLELDDKFRFCGPHRQFAAVIFSSANKSLEGGSFLDHLGSDQCRFVDALSHNTPLDQVSDMLPLLLKDSLGREFAAQAYCTCYEDRKGRHYLIGITETQERMPQEACMMPLVELSSPVRTSMVKRSNPSESTGSDIEEPQEVSEKGEISFAFLDDEEFSLVSCSPGFTALGGPLSQEQPLKQWMRPEDVRHFSNWVQEVGNMFRQYQNIKDVVLSPTHTEKATVEYVAVLSLSILQMTEDSEITFHVLVEEIYARRRSHRSRRRNQPYREKRGPLLGASPPASASASTTCSGPGLCHDSHCEARQRGGAEDPATESPWCPTRGTEQDHSYRSRDAL